MKLTEHISIFSRAVKMVFSNSKRFGICIVLDEIISAVSPYVPIWFSARLLDGLVANEETDKLMLWASLAVFIAFALSTLQTLISTVEQWAEYDMYNLEMWSYSDKAMDIAYETIEDSETKLLVERIKKETQTGWNRFYLYRSLREITFTVTQIITGIGICVGLFTLSSIGLLAKTGLFALFIVTVVVTLLVNRRSQALQNEYWYACIDANVIDDKCSGYMSDYTSGMDIRLYDMTENLEGIMRTCEQKYQDQEKYVALKQVPLDILTESVLHILKFVLYAILLTAAISGEMSVGSIAKYISCVMLVLGSVGHFARILSITLTNNKYLKRYFSYFDIPNNMYKGSLTVEKRDDVEYYVEFQNVSFKYPGSETYALKNINLKFVIGQKLAVVGENGSGKTTMIKLLCRLYDPTEGRILLNGVDIKKYDYDEYMSIFSVVFQDFKLFAFTLGQNIAAATEFDPDKARTVLEKAGFEDRLAEMPDGLDTYLYKNISDKGIEISGGEAQKIALARALYKDAPFLILDEPTAALDPLAEAEIYSRFNEIAGIKTAIYISHRLSSTRFCDEILVFDKGQIVERGSHEALVTQKGKYAALWSAQAQYYV